MSAYQRGYKLRSARLIMGAFNYDIFHALLDQQGHAQAMNYYQEYFPAKGSEETLRDRVQVLSRLKEDYQFSDLRVRTASGASVMTLSSIDYLIGFVCRAVDLSKEL